MAFLAALPAMLGSAVPAISAATGLIGGASALARGSGSQGSNFQAQGAPVTTGMTPEMAQKLYAQSQEGLQQQQAFVNQLQAQNGLTNQSNVFGQQQDLANQLQGATMGQGPNPALAQLAQATGQNVAQQAALMAGQRGAGANTGAIARMAGQQGAGIQQQAAGQAATLAAQQQLAARQQLMQQQGQMAGLSTQQVGQQQTGIQNLNQLTQSEQQNVLNALTGQNQANVSQQNAMNATNQAMAEQNAKQGAKTLESVGQTMAPLMSLAGKPTPKPAGQMAGGFGDQGMPIVPTMHANQGGMVPSSNVGKYLNAAKGASVPGKANVAGDSIKNDTVPAMLSPGEIVIPRSIAQDADAPRKAMEFVAALRAKKGMKR